MGIQIHNGEEQVVWCVRPEPLGHGHPLEPEGQNGPRLLTWPISLSLDKHPD
jgi:hypothetical protein